MYRLLPLIAISAWFTGIAVGADDNDPVNKKLTAAKEGYESATEKARAGLLATLKKRQDAAQKAGDLKTLEKVLAETKAFEESGELPKSVSVKEYESQLRTARARLEETFAAAVKQYTRDGKIPLARATEKELDQLKKDGFAKPDTRKHWIHAKGDFTLLKDGIWEEKSPNGKTYRYKEAARTKQFIEIEALNGDTSLRFRLYDDRCDIGKKAKPGFTTLFTDGKWAR